MTDQGHRCESGVVLIQTRVADHRQAVLRVLMERLGARFAIHAGAAYRNHPLITLAAIRPALRPLRNHYLAGRRLLWQHGALRAGLTPRVLVAEFNPRVLSTWAVLGLRRARGRRTLLWGHAWPDAGRRSRIATARRLMRALASGVIVYAAGEASALATEYPSDRIFVAPNALYREARMTPATGDVTALTDFVFVGPLIESREPRTLLDAFARASGRLPAGTHLVFVGDGPLRASLEDDARRLGSAVTFRGLVRDDVALRDLYSSAIASVHPGDVGLSVTQSLGFGVPVIFSGDRPHGPTIGGAEVGWNAVAFRAADPHGLEETLVAVAADRAAWAERRTAISARCRAQSSAEVAADEILRACGVAV